MTVPATCPVRVDAALALDPFTRPTAPDWTTVSTTSPAVAVSVQRGTKVKTGKLEPSDMWVELDDETADMSPENTSGAYYPDLATRRRVRVVLEPGGGDPDRTLLTGFISEFVKGWQVETATMRLELDDLLTVAGGKMLPGSVFEQTLRSLGAANYWPLGEQSGGVAADVIGGRDGSYLIAASATSALLPYDSRGGQLLGADSNENYRQAVSVSDFPALADEFTWVCALRVPGTWNNTTVDLIRGSNPSSGSLFRLRLNHINTNPHSTLKGQMDRNETTALDRSIDTVSNQDDFGGPDRLHDGTAHLLVWTFKASTDAGNAFYIDGVQIADGEVTHTVSGAGTSAGIETDLTFGKVGIAFPVATVEMSHVAYIPRGLTETEVTELQSAAASAWDGDTVGERLARLFDAVGVDPDDLDLDTGTALCGPTSLGRILRDEVEITVATEPGGVMYAAADGKITFREPVLNGAASEATYADALGGGKVPYEAIDRQPLSVARAINVATVSWVAGEETVEWAEQTTADGPLPENISTIARDAATARAVGARLVYRYGVPRAIVSGVTVLGILASSTLEETVDREVLDVVTIDAQPPDDAAISQKSITEQIAHDWSDGIDWTSGLALVEHVELPTFKFDTADRGWDRTAWGA